MKALIFDVDGTMADTENLHRQAINAAFKKRGLGWHWDVELNRELLAVSGGKERMNAFQQRFSEAERLDQETLAEIHTDKRRFYREMLAEGALTFQPGVLDIIDTARDLGLKLAVATAASAESLSALFEEGLKRPVEDIFDVVVTGDDVSRKKPDPESYLMALGRLGVDAQDALVFEDTPVGYASARGAGIAVVVTPTEHGPQDGEFNDAIAVLPSLAREYWPRFGFPPVP